MNIYILGGSGFETPLAFIVEKLLGLVGGCFLFVPRLATATVVAVDFDFTDIALGAPVVAGGFLEDGPAGASTRTKQVQTKDLVTSNVYDFKNLTLVYSPSCNGLIIL